jgi:hypothetical protein
MMSNMNRLDSKRRALVVRALVEGNGLRATARITGIARMTVEKLFRDLGTACADFHNRTVRNLTSQRIQCDEIWAFCYAKRRTVEKNPSILDRNPDAGDVWTWTALDADSKLMVSWLIGARTAKNAYTILADVKSRITSRIQLTTDQLTVYMRSANRVFGVDVDYAMLHKIYANSGDGGRYSPPRVYRHAQRHHDRRPGPEAHQHVLRGTDEPRHAYGDSPLHSADECSLQETRNAPALRRDSLHVLQLLPDSRDAPADASDGGRCD